MLHLNNVQSFLSIVCPEAAEKLFDLVDNFAESAKRKAAVWPLQIILLILCPEITHTISKDTVEDSKANKVGVGEESPAKQNTHLDALALTPLPVLSPSPETVSGQFAESFIRPGWQQAADGERRHRLRQTVQSLHVHQLGGPLHHLPLGPVHRHGSEGDHYTICHVFLLRAQAKLRRPDLDLI